MANAKAVSLASADPYFKKMIDLAASKRRIKLAIGESLFSTAGVDAGTLLLLRSLLSRECVYSKVLDLGCGYGPLGLMLKAASPEASLHMVDRDALAVRYAGLNASINRFEASTYGSLGYDDVRDSDFDLITSNIPGKAGPPVLESLLLGARSHLRRDGFVAVVVVDALASAVSDILDDDPLVTVTHRAGNKTHCVFHYAFDDAARTAPRPTFADGVYRRHEGKFRHRKLQYAATTVFGLPEFDNLSYLTQLLAEAILDTAPAAESVGVHNPGQGHVPVLLSLALRDPDLHLEDRDLLALRSSAANLARNGLRPPTLSHAVVPAAAVDLYVDVLRPKEPLSAAMARLAGVLEAGTPTVMVAGTSTTVTRVAEKLKTTGPALKLLDRRKLRGFSVSLYESAGRGTARGRDREGIAGMSRT